MRRIRIYSECLQTFHFLWRNQSPQLLDTGRTKKKKKKKKKIKRTKTGEGGGVGGERERKITIFVKQLSKHISGIIARVCVGRRMRMG